MFQDTVQNDKHIMHSLRSQLILKKQLLGEVVDQAGRHAHGEAATELRLDVLPQSGIIFNIGRLLHFGLSHTQPFVAVERKTVPGVCAWNRLPVDQCRFALGHFFLGLPISLAVAEAVLDFAGKLIAFDIACFPSAVLAFENIFAFCHLENLLIF